MNNYVIKRNFLKDFNEYKAIKLSLKSTRLHKMCNCFSPNICMCVCVYGVCVCTVCVCTVCVHEQNSNIIIDLEAVFINYNYLNNLAMSNSNPTLIWLSHKNFLSIVYKICTLELYHI